MEMVPFTVKEAEPLEPDVKINPMVLPRVNVPFETDSVAVSALVPAPLSVMEIALLLPGEKTSDPFSLTVAVEGAAIEGGVIALTVSATLVEPARVSTVSVSEIAIESDPM